MEELGFTLHHSSGDYSSLTYFSKEYPSVSVVNVINENGEKTTKVGSFGTLKYFLSIESGYFQYKHPNIMMFIKITDFYVNLCDKNNPFDYIN